MYCVNRENKHQIYGLDTDKCLSYILGGIAVMDGYILLTYTYVHFLFKKFS